MATGTIAAVDTTRGSNPTAGAGTRTTTTGGGGGGGDTGTAAGVGRNISSSDWPSRTTAARTRSSASAKASNSVTADKVCAGSHNMGPPEEIDDWRVGERRPRLANRPGVCGG